MLVSHLVSCEVKSNIIQNKTEAGVTFDNSFFNNCFDLVQQLKNRSFLGPFSVHKKVEITIN
jgi:hypothetical protein